MIYKGLDDDESKFLNMVVQQQAQQQAEKLRQEKDEILLFRISFALSYYYQEFIIMINS